MMSCFHHVMNRRQLVEKYRIAFVGILLCSLVLATTSLPVLAEETSTEREGEVSVAVGYKAYSTENSASRALEYGYHHSSPVVEIDAATSKDRTHLIFEGQYENENEYDADLHLDSDGTLLFDLRTERFFHNLDHIPYNSAVGARPDASTPLGTLRATYDDQDPGEEYGTRVDISDVHFRSKMQTYPAHINLGYWRMERKGTKQLRFVDDNCAAACHMQSKTRDIDRVTEEFNASVDAHLGFVDLILEQVYRVFRDKEPVPVDDFEFFRTGISAPREHSENPDSSYVATTLKAHTSLSGGVVAAASVTVGERENRSDLSTIAPVEAEIDFYKAAGDLTVTPSEHWTVNFRYRLFDMDTSNSDLLTGALYNSPLLDVRDNVDIKRGEYAASVSYRPQKNLTLKGDYRREEIHRGNTGGAAEYTSSYSASIPAPTGDTATPWGLTNDPVWELPEDEVIDRYRVSVLSRPLGSRRLKINAWYQYQHSDDPAYGTSFKDGHQAFLGANYSHRSNKWGLSGSLNAKDETNNAFEIVQFDSVGEHPYELDRKLQQQNVSFGLWSVPAEGVTAGLNCGYLRSRIVQDLLYGGSPDDYNVVDYDTEYSLAVKTVSAHLNWQMMERLGCRMEVYHIDSFGEYKPSFAGDFSPDKYLSAPDASSYGLREITQVDVRQKGFKLGFDGRINDQLGWSADYAFDDYEDKNSNIYDGTVQTVMASLSMAW